MAQQPLPLRARALLLAGAVAVTAPSALSLSLSRSSLLLPASYSGQHAYFTLTASGYALWTSGDPAVVAARPEPDAACAGGASKSATIITRTPNPDGGVATVTATTVDDGRSVATVTVTVAQLASLSVTPSAASLSVGGRAGAAMAGFTASGARFDSVEGLRFRWSLQQPPYCTAGGALRAGALPPDGVLQGTDPAAAGVLALRGLAESGDAAAVAAAAQGLTPLRMLIEASLGRAPNPAAGATTTNGADPRAAVTLSDAVVLEARGAGRVCLCAQADALDPRGAEAGSPPSWAVPPVACARLRVREQLAVLPRGPLHLAPGGRVHLQLFHRARNAGATTAGGGGNGTSPPQDAAPPLTAVPLPSSQFLWLTSNPRVVGVAVHHGA